MRHGKQCDTLRSSWVRMGRPIRIDPVGGWHHVVNRGVDRRDIFTSDRDRVEFERLLGFAHDRFGLRVHGYCLMSNHYHLPVECPDGGLSDAMQMIGSVYVRHFNERVGRDGPLFRSRFFAGPVTTDAAVVAVARYIHRNPLAFVRPGELVGYRWSSLRAYIGDRRCPPWLRTAVVSALSGGPAGVRELAESQQASSPSLSLDHEVVRHLVEVAVDEHLGDVGAQRASRTAMALMLDQVDEPSAALVRSLLAFPNRSAERTARSRARRRAREHPVFDRVVASALESAA